MDIEKYRQTDGLMDKWTYEWTVGQINGPANVKTERQMDRKMAKHKER